MTYEFKVRCYLMPGAVMTNTGTVTLDTPMTQKALKAAIREEFLSANAHGLQGHEKITVALQKVV